MKGTNIISQEHDLNRLKINWDQSEPTVKFKSRWKHFLLSGGMVLLAIVAGAYFVFSKTPLKVEVATVISMTSSQSTSVLNASGYVVALQKAAIASKGTGRLISLKVKEGDQVIKGEVLAQLENADVMAALSRARAGLGVALSARDQAKADLNEASLSFQRGQSLLQGGLISKADFDGLEAKYLRAQASLNSAEAGVHMAEAGIRSAEVDVENTYIRAPFNGTVLAKNAEVGEVVAPFGSSVYAKSAVLTIADMSSLEVDADVSESSIEKISPGQPCEIVLDAYPSAQFKGKVKTIVPTADRAKATVLTKIEFLSRDNRILPEMSAKVSFLAPVNNKEPERSMTVIPPAALMTKNNQKVVFLVKNEKVIETHVDVGPPAGGWIEITKGLQPGDQVVLNPSEKLTTGAKIKY